MTDRISHTTDAPLGGGSQHAVSVVILNYDADPALVSAAVRSVLDSTAMSADDPVMLREVIVADNASPTDGPGARAAVEALPTPPGVSVRWLPLAQNYGFAGGNNRAIATCDPDCDFVFLLNPDAAVEPDALHRCAAALLAAEPACVAIAPKMLLMLPDSDESILDAVGNAVNGKGEAFNVGLGQPDLGQYDEPARCFGPCFGAALFRRDAFDIGKVGPLDESLFLYYEDVDWNWRSQLLGFHARTEPSARIRHVMSATTRHLDYSFKFHLTERNLLLCVLKNFRLRTAASIWFWRCGGLLLGAVRGHYPKAGLKAVAGALRRAPRTLAARRPLQRHRVRTDPEILVYGLGQQTFFDAQRYVPTNHAEALAYAQSRLAHSRRPL